MILGVLGPGALGLSAAQHAAERGLRVRLLGRDAAHADRGRVELERRWKSAMQRGRMDAEARDRAGAQLSAQALDVAALEGLDALLEALPEDRAIKAAAWAGLAAALPERCLRLTGSSSLPVRELDAAAGLGGRLLGFHLFVPVNRMALVELVAPPPAPDLAEAEALAERLGLRAVRVKDGPGYAASRMALAQGLEAMRLLERGAASAEDLDALLVLGYGHPVGPLELSDRVGLDLRLRIAEELFAADGDPRFEPPAILREKVARGETGRKAGRGFLDWEGRP